MQNSKFIKVVTVTDPDTKLPVEIEIRKLDSGAMVGIDASYLQQLGDDEQPFCPYDGQLFNIPDNEEVNV